MIHIYSVQNDTNNGQVDLGQLVFEFESLSYEKITIKGDVISIYTDDPKTSFDPIVSAHSGDPLLVYKSIVRNAINFFNEELVKFSAENIIMGITVLNKTKDVADYLQSVMRYGQSGSLYEVVHEVDTLIAAGIPGDLAPFVTDARLTALKNQILDYLA